MVAYSEQRRHHKNSKTIGKHSPKNSFFGNNLNEMSGVWSKYRRNLQEASQKSKAHHKAHSLSRQDQLMQKHKHIHQNQLSQMHERVNQY